MRCRKEPRLRYRQDRHTPYTRGRNSELPRDWLEDAVDQAVRSRFANEAAIRELLDRAEPTRPSTEPRAEALRAELERARQAYLRGVFTLDEYADARREVEDALRALQAPTGDEEPVDCPLSRRRRPTLPLREFLQAAGLLVYATPTDVHLKFVP